MLLEKQSFLLRESGLKPLDLCAFELFQSKNIDYLSESCVFVTFSPIVLNQVLSIKGKNKGTILKLS